MKKTIKIIYIFIITILICSNIVFASIDDEETVEVLELNQEVIEASADLVKEPQINSRAAIIFDRNSKRAIYNKNIEIRRPMASTTKIMTAIVLLENLGINNDLTLDSEIEVCKQAGAIGGSRLGLKTGDKVTVNDLLYGLMLCSRK